MFLFTRLENIPSSLFIVAGRKMALHYINKGVVPQEAQVLALIEILLGERLYFLESNGVIVDEHTRSFEEKSHYYIDDSGHVIQLQIGPQNYYVDRNRADDMSIIPHEISLLKNLRELHVYDLPLRIIPESIGDIISLRKLSIYGTRLKYVPKTIGKLKNLEILSLANNNLIEIPKSIGYLKNLLDLQLHENELNNIPKSIGKLRNLNRIFLSKNKLQEIPKSIGNLERKGTTVYK